MNLQELLDDSGEVTEKLYKAANAVESNQSEILDAYIKQGFTIRWASAELHYFIEKLRNFNACLEKAASRGVMLGYEPAQFQVESGVAVLGSSNSYLMLLANTLWTKAAGVDFLFRPSSALSEVNNAVANALGSDKSIESLTKNINLGGIPTLLNVQNVSGKDFLHNLVFSKNSITRFMMFTGWHPLSRPDFHNGFKTKKHLIGLIEGGGNDLMYVAPEADTADAARIALAGLGPAGGLHCTRPKVILVHEKNYSSLASEMKSQARRVLHGPPNDISTHISAMPLKNAIRFLYLVQDAIGNIDSKGSVIFVGDYSSNTHLGSQMSIGGWDGNIKIPNGTVPIFLNPNNHNTAFVPLFIIAPAKNKQTGLYHTKGFMEEMFGPSLLLFRLNDFEQGGENELFHYLRQDREQLTFTYTGDPNTDLAKKITNFMEPKVASVYINASMFDEGQFDHLTLWGGGIRGNIKSSAIIRQLNGGKIKYEVAGPRDFIRDLCQSPLDKSYRTS